jgi:hypothetical protein
MSTPGKDVKAATANAAPKVHPLTVLFHALADSIESSTKRKQIIAALAELTDSDVPAALKVSTSAAALAAKETTSTAAASPKETPSE